MLRGADAARERWGQPGVVIATSLFTYNFVAPVFEYPGANALLYEQYLTYNNALGAKLPKRRHKKQQVPRGSSATANSMTSPKFTGLAAELVAHIALFLPQVDLLNLSLTCKTLRQHAESALYREYVQPHRSPLSSFVGRIVARPDIGEKYVRRVELHSWTTRISKPRPRVLSRQDYDKFTKAAKAAQVIDLSSRMKPQGRPQRKLLATTTRNGSRIS